MRDQPTPEVGPGDLERVIRRDFPAAAFAEVWRTLDACDSSPAPCSARLELAVLKLAAGDLLALREWIEDATRGHRDVLAWAGCPGSMRMVPGSGQPPELDRIIEADWQQYLAWLVR